MSKTKIILRSLVGVVVVFIVVFIINHFLNIKNQKTSCSQDAYRRSIDAISVVEKKQIYDFYYKTCLERNGIN